MPDEGKCVPLFAATVRQQASGLRLYDRPHASEDMRRGPSYSAKYMHFLTSEHLSIRLGL